MNKLSIFIIVLSICLLSPILNAQNNNIPATPKQSVIVDYFNSANGDFYSFADYMRTQTIEGAKSANRVNVFNADDYLELRAYDPNNYGTIQYMRDRYDKMLNLGANYIIECEISNINAYPINNNKKEWKANASYTLRLIDLVSGRVMGRTLHNPTSPTTSYDSRSKAINSSLSQIYSEAKVLILDNIRIKGAVIDVANLKNANEVKDVYLNVGPDNGAKDGAKFEVFTNKVVAGQNASIKIGEVKISEIQGNTLSIAKVTKGGKDIKKALDNHENLSIISTASGFWDNF